MFRRFRDYPLVLEVRHASWKLEAILDILAELRIGLRNIDQPLFAKSIAPGAQVTSSVGYIRLHRRNYQNWFPENPQTGDRYNYLYSLDELGPSRGLRNSQAIAGRTQDALRHKRNRGERVVR